MSATLRLTREGTGIELRRGRFEISPGVQIEMLADGVGHSTASKAPYRTHVRLSCPDVDDDPFEPHDLERLRRSISMLTPGQPAGLDRERAVRILDELQRLQRSDRRYRQLVDQLQTMLDGLESRELPAD